MRLHVAVPVIVLSIALVLPATAQRRGGAVVPPASVTSIPGTMPPASVTSIQTERALAGRNFGGSVGFGHNPRFHVGVNGGRRHHRGGVVGYPYYYAPYYGYGYDYDYNYDDAQSLDNAGTFNNGQQPTIVIQTAPPGQTVFEHRGHNTDSDDPRYGTHYLDNRESARNTPAQNAPAAQDNLIDDGPATVLVFRDGHKQEVRNYAIMGDTLITLAGPRQKIPLASLNIEQTVKENDERGADFRLPAGYKG